MVSGAELPSFSFHARAHHPDGGCTFSGIAILGLVAVSTAIALGLVEGFLESVGFSIFIVSAGFIGWGLGYLQGHGVRIGKVRSRLVCGVLATLSGCIVFVCTHLFHFYQVEKNFVEVAPPVREVARNFAQLQRNRDEQPPDVQSLLDEFVKQPELRESLAVNGFFDYLDLMARRGLRVIDQKDRRRAPERFSYAGTYGYWVAEILVMAVVAFGCMVSKTSYPFCMVCETWKNPIATAFVMGVPTKAKHSLEAGDLSAFIPVEALQPGAEPLRLTLLGCPNCGSSQQIEVQLESTSPNTGWDGKTIPKPQKTLCTVTYPSEAQSAFEAILQAPIWQQGVKVATSATDGELGQLIMFLAWAVIGVASLILCGAIVACLYFAEFSPTGFVVSVILFACGWGLRWVAQRERKRH